MASAIAMMIMGAVLNASAFTGSMYLAKALSSDPKHTDGERLRHDKALEKYQQDMGEFEKDRQLYQDWLTTQYERKNIADNNLRNTDHNFKLYRDVHPESNINKQEPQFSDYYKPSSKQKQYEILYVGGGMLTAGYLASKII